MIIDIEIIVGGIIILVILFWFIWFKFTGWRNKKKYNPENDKGRKAEESRKEGRREESFRREQPTQTTTISVDRFEEPKGSGVLPTAEIVVTGKTDNGNGNVGKKFRNPFRRKH